MPVEFAAMDIKATGNWNPSSTGKPLIIDAARHRPVQDNGPSPLEATLYAIQDEQPVQQRAMMSGAIHSQVRKRDVTSNSLGGTSMAFPAVELSGRRREAIKAAYRRVDPSSAGSVTSKELVDAMQRLGSLAPTEQSKVAQGMGSTSSGGKVSLALFSSYYQQLGNSIELDRDFEDVMVHHWGFPEVSDILADMKNKFAMVGMAYAFRKSLEAGHAELSLDGFQDALGRVAMHYSRGSLQRVFDAFADGDAASHLEVRSFTEHLTSAPRPSTPMSLRPTAAMAQAPAKASPPGRLPAPAAAPPEAGWFSHLGGRDVKVGHGGGDGKVSKFAGISAPPLAPPEEGYDDVQGSVAAPEKIQTAAQEDDEDDDGAHAPQESPFGKPTAKPKAAAKAAAAPKAAPIAPGGKKPGAMGGSAPAAPVPVTTPSPPTQSPGVLSPAAASAASGKPACRRRAVTIGINYIGTPNALAGCINDSDTFIELLTQDMFVEVADIRQLRDDHPQRMPTKKNITAALKWLVNGAQDGDHLFLHYSGHGSQVKDTNSKEDDGMSEVLVPCDFQQNGFLVDTELRKILVSTLSSGVRLTCLLDCCHSATMMNLPYQVLVTETGSSTKMSSPPDEPTEAEVLSISGCLDNQTSADVQGGSLVSKAAGAMTTAFKTVLSANLEISYHNLLQGMRKWLKANGFEQVPQMYTEHCMNMTMCFIPEHETAPQAVVQSVPTSLRPAVRKALTIGINYLKLPKGQGQLSGCINDSDTIIGILNDIFKFQDSQIKRLRDDRNKGEEMPTRSNVMAALQWLTEGSKEGDEMFLHYSGHGGTQADKDGDEEGGQDQTMIPCDFQSAGQIVDDDLHALCVRNLPAGARFWGIMDCCHSGSILDFAFQVKVTDDNAMSCEKLRSRKDRGDVSMANSIMISGCRDDQCSADVGAGSLGSNKAAGAMTTAFKNCMTPTITCHDLLINMRTFLTKSKFEQVPQMSSDHYIQLDSSFLGYAMKAPAKRAIAYGQASAPASAPAPTATSPMKQPQTGGRTEGSEAIDSRIQRLEHQIMELQRQQLQSPQPAGPSSPLVYFPASAPMWPQAGVWGSYGMPGGMSMPGSMPGGMPGGMTSYGVPAYAVQMSG